MTEHPTDRAACPFHRTRPDDGHALHCDSCTSATRRRESDRGVQGRAEFPDRPRLLLGWSHLLCGKRHRQHPHHLPRQPNAASDAVLHSPEHGQCGRAGATGPGARPRVSVESVSVRIPDVRRRHERDDLQPDCPHHREREPGHLIHGDSPAATPERRNEPQRWRDRLRLGREALGGRRREREPIALSKSVEPTGKSPPHELRRNRPDR